MEPVNGGALGRKGSFGRPRQLGQALGVGQPALLDGKVPHLALPQRRALDLAYLVGQEVLLAFALAGLPLELLEAQSKPPRPLEGLGVLANGADVGPLGEAVQEVGLRGGGQEPLLLALAVNLDQLRADRGERRHGHDLPSDAGRALPVLRHRASEDHLAVLRPLRYGGDGRRREPCLHAGPSPSAADPRPRRPAPERQGQAHGHHGLPGAGLAGHHVQPGMELQLEVFDHSQAGDVELEQHAPQDSSACLNAWHIFRQQSFSRLFRPWAPRL